jgi:hypothetical protein
LVAEDFVGWLGIVPGSPLARRRVRDGRALSSAIIRTAAPAEVLAVDPAEGFVAAANALIGGTHFVASVGDAAELPFPTTTSTWSSRASFSTSFPISAARSRKRAASRGRAGTIGAYVWDYAGENADDPAVLGRGRGIRPGCAGTR